MPAQQQFDGQAAVPGYTLFHGKDGQNFYLKGENLSDDEVSAKVATIRGASLGVQEGAPDANVQARATVRQPFDQLQEKAFSIFTPTGDVPQGQLQATRTANNVTLAGATTLAAAVPAIAGALAPTVGSETVGTGILDASGSQIMREISTYGPSQAAKAYQALQAAGNAHPLVRNILAYGLASAGLGTIAHKLGWLGKAVQ